MLRASLRVSGCVLCLWVGAISATAATNTAASASYADVSAAVAAAADGDTLKIPAGTELWGSTLQVTKGLTLLGAGTNLTRINGSGANTVYVALQADKPVRISGIGFNCDYGHSAILMVGIPLTAFRIDHCRFQGGYRTVQPSGWCYGVIDHCAFVDPRIGVGPVGDGDFAWLRPVQPGTTNCVCIEDCEFWFTSAVNTPPPGVSAWPQQLIYHQEATRSIIRHCSFDATGYTADSQDFSFIDGHGNQNYYSNNPSADFRGTVLIECYSNVFRSYQSGRFMYYRGSSLLVYGNTMTNVATASSFPIVLTEEEGWQTDFFQPLRTVWPAQDQITNSYFWGNTYNGNLTTPYITALNNYSDAIFIQEGRDYWLHAPGVTNVYYPYAPLAYPHPLVRGQDTRAAVNTAVAMIRATATSGVAPLTVSFSSGGSYGAKGVSLSYYWAFGDGATSTDANPVHSYSQPGVYGSRLTVSDGISTSASGVATITVRAGPP
jgi:PKD repeat protein